jgi:electron-transferring-flavoprotein dehydrogenase
MEYDVVIVGAGPAGLSAAIRIKQQAAEKGQDISVLVLEKGSEVGAHILSGAVFEPRALNELIPDWKEKGAPLNVPAADDAFKFMTSKTSYKLPTPPQMHNEGNFVISLGNLTRWLAEQAEAVEVEIYPASPPPKCSTTTMAASAASSLGTWASARTGNPPMTTSPAWNCAPNIRSSRRVAAAP